MPAGEGRQLVGDEDDVAGAPRRLQRRDDAADAGADIVDADEVGMLGEKRRRQHLHPVVVIAALADRQ